MPAADPIHARSRPHPCPQQTPSMPAEHPCANHDNVQIRLHLPRFERLGSGFRSFCSATSSLSALGSAFVLKSTVASASASSENSWCRSSSCCSTNSMALQSISSEVALVCQSFATKNKHITAQSRQTYPDHTQYITHNPVRHRAKRCPGGRRKCNPHAQAQVLGHLQPKEHSRQETTTF